MIRLVVVVLIAAAVIASTWMHVYWLAMTAGIASGAILFLYGVATGGALGNARAYEKRPSDINARIGVALAAMSVAVEGIRPDQPFPPTFRIFCVACQCLGAVIAIMLATRALRPLVSR